MALETNAEYLLTVLPLYRSLLRDHGKPYLLLFVIPYDVGSKTDEWISSFS
jgi:hypothetical protein